MLVSRCSRRAVAPGYTALELLVALALTALVLGLAAPSLDSLVARQRLRAASYDLLTDLTLARSESLKRGGPVDLAPAGQDRHWGAGWIVSTGPGQVIAQRPPLGGALFILNAPERVQFNARGQVEASAPVRFDLADGRGGERCITLDPSGRARSLARACS